LEAHGLHGFKPWPSINFEIIFGNKILKGFLLVFENNVFWKDFHLYFWILRRVFLMFCKYDLKESIFWILGFLKKTILWK